MSRRIFGFLSFLLPLSALALLLSGCGPAGTAVERGDRDQILHATLGAAPGSLDPHLVTDVASFDVLRALLEGLVTEDPRDLSPAPGVAERWEISDDGKTYTFHLRPDARWSNGDPVTAADFLFSFERVLSPALGAPYAEMLFMVENARGFNSREVDDFSDVGFAAPDERTLEIRLENPTPYFLGLLANPAWWPVHPPTILEHGRIDQRATGWTRAGRFVGNGPFHLTEWRTGRKLVTMRNSHYWDAETVRLNEIHFHPIDSSDTQERAFRSGQLHFTKSLPPNRVDHYQRNHPGLVRSEPYLGVYFYRLNTDRPPFDDPRVRQAFSLAIDRGSLVRNVLHDKADVAQAFTPPETAGYTADPGLDFDPERARALLAEAGFPNGEGLPRVDLLFNTHELHRQLAEAIQQMLRTHLNIQLHLFNQEFQAYLSSVQSRNFQMARAAWIGDYLDPDTFLGLWLTDGGHNNTGWSNEDYDRLMAEAARTLDRDERFALLREAESLLMEELPILPIFHYRNNFLIRPSVQGWYSNVLDRQPYKYIYLEPQDQ